MKVSVSLPKRDVEFIDAHVGESGLKSRSAVVQKAVRLLREAQLRAAYTSAWEEWFEIDDAAAWEGTTGDGVAAT